MIIFIQDLINFIENKFLLSVGQYQFEIKNILLKINTNL